MSVRTLISNRGKSTSVLRNVVVVAGTHGNERSGIHLVKHFENNPDALARPSFQATCLLSNVEAIKADRRYVSTDLNRTFDLDSLQTALKMDAQARNVEQARSLEVDAQLGPKFDNPKTDMIFDLHNTTSNCGVLLCFHKDDTFSREVAAYLRQYDPEICTVFWPQDDPPYLPTVARSGMTVEVGPQAHSTVRAAIYERTRKLIHRALDYIELHNKYMADPSNSAIETVEVKLPVAERNAEIDYPRDGDGNLSAFVHPSLQGVPELDPLHPIKDGDPLFQDLEGNTIALDLARYGLDPSQVYYPMFVNEAAYYEKGVALVLTSLREYSVRIHTLDNAKL
ncbi:Probable aspartoacylase [Durusdinium trenchii]|uniref:Probable aspartoacylase n=1 Tax=Durusdinium trenchii TaxID=1381693 RepID=A0ABP0NXX4_9DINO